MRESYRLPWEQREQIASAQDLKIVHRERACTHTATNYTPVVRTRFTIFKSHSTNTSTSSGFPLRAPHVTVCLYVTLGGPKCAAWSTWPNDNPENITVLYSTTYRVARKLRALQVTNRLLHNFTKTAMPTCALIQRHKPTFYNTAF